MGLFGPDKMSIVLQEINYRPGDVIRGTVELKLDKPTRARNLMVALLGKKRTSRRDIDGDIETRDDIIYELRLPLDGEKEYLNEVYPFEIKIQPDVLQGNQLGMTIHRELEKKLGGLGSIIADIATGHNPIRWMVLAYLDMPMKMDIKKSQDIVISPG